MRWRTNNDKRNTIYWWLHILQNRHFIVQERLHKLIYSMNIIIKCGTWQPVKFQLVSRSWMKWFFLSYLWINVASINSEIQCTIKNHFIFDPVQKRETNWNFTGCQMPHFMIVLILYANLLNLSWNKKMSVLRSMEPLNHDAQTKNNRASRKHAYIILTPLNPTFI